MADPHATFFCLTDDCECRWDRSVESRCAQAETPENDGARIDGHRVLIPHPTRYTGDATGARLSVPNYTFRRYSLPVGRYGTPPGFDAPDGRVHLALSPFTRTDDGDSEHYDQWPSGADMGNATCGYVREGGQDLRRAYLYCTPRSPWPIDLIDVELRPHRSRRMGFIHTSQVSGNGICLVTWWTHRCWGKYPSTGSWFIDEPDIFNYCGFDLSAAHLKPAPPAVCPEPIDLKNLALQKISTLTGPNMDLMKKYGGQEYSARLQPWYERRWPDSEEAPEHAGEWPLIKTLTAELRQSGHRFPVDLVFKAVRVTMHLQVLASNGANDQNLGVLPAVAFEVSVQCDLRLNLGASYPSFAPPVTITRDWRDPPDTVEVTTLWPQDGATGMSVSPGLRGGGAKLWTPDSEELVFWDPASEQYYTPPLEFSWRGELGPNTDPQWPNWQQATLDYQRQSRCCGIVCSMRPLVVPALRTRKIGDWAADPYGGEVSLTMAPGDDDICEAGASGICDPE